MSDIPRTDPTTTSERSVGGHSATVRLRVTVGGDTFRLSAVGGEHLHFAVPTILPSGRAELLVEIDGRAHTGDIELPGPDEQVHSPHDCDALNAGNTPDRSESTKARFRFVTA